MALKIDFNKIVKKVVTIAYVQSCIANIEAISNIPVDNEALQKIFAQIILQYVHVRAHSFANDQVQKYKQKFKVSKVKRLCTELKRSAEEH